MNMENLTVPLLNFGIGGIMAASVVLFLRHLVAETIPALLKECRQERAEDREVNRELLVNQQASFERVLTEIRVGHERALADLGQRLDALTDMVCGKHRDDHV